jgi:hypothetical protein
MEIDNLNELIIKSLENFDENILKYDKYFHNEVNINHETNEIKFFDDNNKNNYQNDFEILGLFDNTNNIWIWGWAIYINNNQIKIVKDLLNYGLKIEPGLHSSVEYSFIKSLLVNSRILIENDIELNINLGIIFNLIKNKCSFIFPNKYYLDDIKYITYYYIVK